MLQVYFHSPGFRLIYAKKAPGVSRRLAFYLACARVRDAAGHDRTRTYVP